MCGRYASARKRIELLEEFRIERDRVPEPLAPDYNVAPTKRVYAVVTRDARPSEAAEPDAADEAGEAAEAPAEGVARELRVVRWGLVPFWAKDPSIGSRMINARAETVQSKPAFRQAFKRRRCLLPADGYYEWQRLDGKGETDSPGGKVPKQPFFITRRDGGPLAFAGLYELWRDPAVDRDDEDAWLWTTTVITTSASDELGMIHDRMPMIIDPVSWADWLDPANSDVADVRALLAPAAASGLTTFPVSTEVNSVRNNGPQLIEPIGRGSAAPLAGIGADTRTGAEDGARDRGDGGTGVLF